MRDDDRIDLYCRFGTIDWRSEAASGGGRKERRGVFRGAVRYLKLATLLWSIVLRELKNDKNV